MISRRTEHRRTYRTALIPMKAAVPSDTPLVVISLLSSLSEAGTFCALHIFALCPIPMLPNVIRLGGDTMRVDLKAIEPFLNEPVVQTGLKNGFLLLKTPSARWLVKPVDRTEKMFWWQRADRLIRKKGFRSMPDFFVWQDRWLVMRYIPGRTARYRNVWDLRQSAVLLARFHRKAIAVETPPDFDVRRTLADRLVNRFEQYEKVCRQLSAFPQFAFASEDFRRHGERALNRIDRTALRRVVSSGVEEGTVAHRDLASHNILIGVTGKPWLIDFETADLDAQLGDLWQLASRALVEWHWNPHVFAFILRTYEAIRPLSTDEKRLLSQLFLFPNDFYREALGLIKHRQGFDEQKVIPYLQMLVRDERKWNAFLSWLGVA